VRREGKVSGARIRTTVLAAVILIALVVLFLLLRPGSPAPESSDLEEQTQEEQTQEEVVAVAINEGIMSPPEVTVYEGNQVNLQIISDRPIELHLHGYDLTEEVEPGETADLSFEATDTGRFAIEDHDTDAEIGVLLVQPL
jgi:heme/copper-type cytochrome/quinol oxidase subunit 2